MINYYITLLVHKLGLETGLDDTTLTEYALLFLAAGLEPADTPHDWATILQGIPKETSTKAIVETLEMAMDRYLEELEE